LFYLSQFIFQSVYIVFQFYFCLALIFLAEVIIGIVALVFKDQAIDVVSDALRSVYVVDYHYDHERFMDYFQETVSSNLRVLILYTCFVKRFAFLCISSQVK